MDATIAHQCAARDAAQCYVFRSTATDRVATGSATAGNIFATTGLNRGVARYAAIGQIRRTTAADRGADRRAGTEDIFSAAHRVPGDNTAGNTFRAATEDEGVDGSAPNSLATTGFYRRVAGDAAARHPFNPAATYD